MQVAMVLGKVESGKIFLFTCWAGSAVQEEIYIIYGLDYSG